MVKSGWCPVITNSHSIRLAPPLRPYRVTRLSPNPLFGLPIFRWPAPGETLAEINAWWRGNQQAGKASVLFAYPLGKSQRVMAGIDSSIGPVYTHGAVELCNGIYREM